jgi:Tfp pilus assembly protein PilX
MHAGGAQDSGRGRERGVALAITFLMLTVVLAIGLVMVISLSSDTMINGYYLNYRGAFYAADGGLNIARQRLVNETLALVPGTFPVGTYPLPAGTDTTVQTTVANAYNSYTRINTGGANNAWSEQFKISSVSFAAATWPPTVTSVDSHGDPASYQYTYNYSLTSLGQSRGSEQTTVSESGAVIVNVTLMPTGGVTTSFAAWGMFIDQYTQCGGGLAPGIISGPVFTNGAWTFGTSGSYIFTDTVGSASSTFGYQFSSTCKTSSATSYTYSGTTIRPTFQNGVSLGAGALPLPDNDFSQKRAVLDGLGTDTSAVTNAQLNAVLKNINGTAYPTGGATSGVYISYPGTGGSAVSGGGIYVEGDAQITLSPSGASGQVFTIKQGSTTTTITVDSAANTTTFASGSTSKTLTGVFQSLTGTPRAATMVYVNGDLTALKGPGEGVAAINDGAQVTITAKNEITITGDILYKTQPVTKTQNQIPGTPADTLIPGNDKGQVLGIFTAGGDINFDNGQSSRNLEVDASLATIATGGSGGLVNTGTAINTLTIVGGRIHNKIKASAVTTRNVFFDRRFSTGTTAPPWFPSTTVSQPGTDSAITVPSVQRVKWLNMTTQ